MNIVNKYLTANNSTKYINVLPDLVHNYNNSYHNGIDGIPAKYMEDRIKQINIEKQNKAKQEETIFKIGDSVRYIINRVAFAKCTPPKWSATIRKLISKYLHSYTLDNDKKFQYYYLQKVTENESFTPAIIPAQIKTRDELQKNQRRTRILQRENIDESTIIKERRIPKLKEQFKSLLSR